MPWTGQEFKSKHWKNGTPDQQDKAARIATAIVNEGGDEGMAIATGIRRAKGQPMHRRGKQLGRRGLISEKQAHKNGL